MAQVFISYSRADAEEATALAKGLEAAGVSTWYYTRDTRPGPSYLLQIAAAISSCDAIVVIVSRESVESPQITSEIVLGFEQKKHFVPILHGLSHLEFQPLQPEWRAAFRAATSIAIPNEGVEAILPALIEGLVALSVSRGTVELPNAVPSPQAPVSNATQSGAKVVPFVPFPQSTTPPVNVELMARFDHSSYPHGEDSLAYWLAEFQLEPETALDEISEEDRLGADIALVLDVSGSMQKPNRYPFLRDAVRRLVSGLGSQDRVCVILFTERSKTVVPFMDGDRAAEDPDHIVRAMDNSGILYGPNTLLAPGLQLALDAFGPPAQSGGRVRRMYVMTDGELHDAGECMTALYGFRPQSVEVHVYGFGEDFNATALKLLVSDQIGGTVKPIVNEQDITQTFAHVAAVNRRLVGHDGKLSVTLGPNVVSGDAWVYQPHGRYLGPIRDRRVEYLFGGIEAGRRYSLLVEVRLPAADEPVATVEAEWISRDQAQTHRIEVSVPRGGVAAEIAIDVRRAVDILQVLRAADDKSIQLASYKARRELAALENRDPELIAALDKRIAELANPTPEMTLAADMPNTWTKFAPRSKLTAREQQLVEADDSSSVPFRFSTNEEMEAIVLQDLNAVLTSGASTLEVIDMATKRLLVYVRDGFDGNRAAELLRELGSHVGLSPRMTYGFIRRLSNGAHEIPNDD